MGKLKQKKPVKRGLDEELMIFVIKIVSTTAFLFITAIGADVYRLIH